MSHRLVQKCVPKRFPIISNRQFNTGDFLDKMHTKGVVVAQLKLITQLKDYLSKFAGERSLDSPLPKELAHLLQRLQPAVYGSDLRRYFESLTAPAPPALLAALRLRPPPPKWRARLAPPPAPVADETRRLLAGLLAAPSPDALLRRIDAFSAHLAEHPGARHCAVRDGAVRLLLAAQHGAHSLLVQQAANETLALLGHVKPVRARGVRILSIDGGGVRGIIVIEMLKKLEELTGKSICDLFDLICGVSTGAIITTLINKQSTLDEIAAIYKNLSTQIFTQSALRGTSSLVWSHSYYDTAQWERLLKQHIGDQTLISTARNLTAPKMCAVSAVVNQSQLSAYVFRNYNLPCRVQSQYAGSHRHLIWESVRASAAAPTYFEEFKLGSMLHQDGGIIFNNPTAVAIHEARLLWPTTPIQCVVSFGTGRTIPMALDPNGCETQVANSSWKNKFFAIIDSATDTEGVHTMLSDLLAGNEYFRFNPYLTEMMDIAEIEPGKLEQLKRDAVMYLRRNEDKFQDAAKVLCLEKTVGQRVAEWAALKGVIHGLGN